MNKKYDIKSIKGLKFIAPKTKLIKKNKPDFIKVTENEYLQFIEKNKEYIKSSHINTVSEKLFVEDYYENIIAGVDFCVYETNKKFYINPELLKLGIEKKKKIDDEREVIGEDVVLEINEIKPFFIETAKQDIKYI